ncbi:hypothetical protein EL17_00995 [Anditalea andensis]|uniref:Outer membrane protein beta-barrel domain-containing protein n=2 Tax=Anditalea andensis TaxID=1048983 RepID=A0A074L4P1_9BACT|nr:hypothetical protein EL17_00995 [Anditalea andensis]
MLFFSYSYAYAQEEEKYQFGIKAGVNYATLFGKDAFPESDRKVGYSFGVYTNYKLSHNFKIQPEIIWSLQGEETENKTRYNISYINIPIMLKWLKDRYYFELGPQLGVLTIHSNSSVPHDIRLDNFDTFDLLINVGLGYEVAEDWNIGIRYSHGLTNLVNGLDLKNSVFYIGFSYRIH